MEIKKCNKCMREKPWYEFYKDKDKVCIECTKKYNYEKKIVEKV